MDYVGYILIILFVLFVFSRFLPTKGVRQITTSELKAELQSKNKQFIDVRTPAEFKGRNIRGFKNIPLNVLGSKLNQLKKDQEVVVICQSGMRSAQASKLLKKQGFTRVTNVKGGMSQWV
ncbi:MAG: rhodanese-like domain-containing protein [Bacillaceae bacterium]